MRDSSYLEKSSSAIHSKCTTPDRPSANDRWAIVLAGGDGTRLLSLTRKIAGDDRPKQFCSLLNGNTLLEETRRRVSLTFSPERTMFVLTQKHDRYYSEALDGVPHRNLVVQPRNAGTAPAILYGLKRLEKINPTATAAFFPSDHYLSDDKAFMAEVDLAFAAASRRPDSVILLGIEPENPDEEYGWIEPERETSTITTTGMRRVRRFWEKPSPTLARELMERGCLWNSFVMVGTVSAFLKMIRHATSELFERFSEIESKISTPQEASTIRTLYGEIVDTNFSKEVLQRRPGDLAVLRVSSSKWSDLGNPDRVFATLAEIGDGSFAKYAPKPSHLMKPHEGDYERARVRGSQVV